MISADFVAAMQKGYAFQGEAMLLRSALFEGAAHPEAAVRLPLRTLNRHGLVSGATETGKTKTLALIGGYDAFSKSATTGLPAIRRVIAGIKELPGYTPAIGEAMQAIGSEVHVDPDTYKPTLTAEAMPGHVRIRGTKKGVQAMNIYRRIKGQSNWQLAAGNRTKFPFDDDAPLAQPGIPETREYSVIGMMANEEVGLRSDLAVVTYGG